MKKVLPFVLLLIIGVFFSSCIKESLIEENEDAIQATNGITDNMDDGAGFSVAQD